MFGHVNDLISSLLGELGSKSIHAVAEVVKDRIPTDLADVSSTPA
jgi:hypothetical protein